MRLVHTAVYDVAAMAAVACCCDYCHTAVRDEH